VWVHLCIVNSIINQKQIIMNALRNKVQLIGRLGQDPDIKTLESGKKVAHFTMATNENYKSADGSKTEETTWHNIVAWNGLAELASKYLKKGKEVCIEGRISYRSYTDKNGVPKSVTEIVASDLVLLSSGGTAREELPKESKVREGKAKAKIA